MSPGLAISCEALSKRYYVKAPGSRKKTEFWALRDVSFEVEPGEVLGVVGRNGAGKSTLLKILSRITQPTAGQIALRGRLASLLEVGTGFHPELTGRENIFLNGTLLGMSRGDVLTQFDSIVDFAGVSYFLDTPVKRYSSGMYVRLAFAVAAHLRNEILVLDEVLAVGDAAFQQKCLGKVHDLARDQGRTVLMVSHNADVIREHATRAISLHAGRLLSDGPVEEIIGGLASTEVPHSASLVDAPRVDSNWGALVRIVAAEVLNAGRVTMGEDLQYTVDVDVRAPMLLGVGQCVTASDDTPLATSFSSLVPIPAGRSRFIVRVPRPPLAPGRYGLNLVVGQASFAAPDLHYDGVLRAVAFDVAAVAGALVDWHPEWWGAVAMETPVVVRVEP